MCRDSLIAKDESLVKQLVDKLTQKLKEAKEWLNLDDKVLGQTEEAQQYLIKLKWEVEVKRELKDTCQQELEDICHEDGHEASGRGSGD